MVSTQTRCPRPTGSMAVITAGASAPESVVQDCVHWLRDRFAAAVEERTIREEEVYFPLPKELRAAAAAVRLPMA